MYGLLVTGRLLEIKKYASMASTFDQPRRSDFVMAEKLRQGVLLLQIAGADEARLYLLIYLPPPQDPDHEHDYF